MSSQDMPVDREPVTAVLGITDRDLLGRVFYQLNRLCESTHGGNGPLVTFTGTTWSVNLARVAALYANSRAKERRHSWTGGIVGGPCPVAGVHLTQAVRHCAR